LDPEADAIQKFAFELRELRQKVGSPAYRQLARVAHYSSATLAEAAGGRKLPSLPVTLAYVRACGGDESRWEARWRAVAGQDTPKAHAQDETIRSPYRGLVCHDEQDSDWFFGRERLVEHVLDLLSGRRFVAVVGASGVGKSSVLRAGVLPRWRAAAEGRRAVVFTPGASPVEECAVHLAGLVRYPPGQVVAELNGDPRALHRLVRQILAGRPETDELMVVVDQFEEIFTLCRSDTERGRFVDMLLCAATAPNSRCRIVLGVRADFYPHCTSWPGLVTMFTEAQVPVGPMTTEELRRAIVQPAVRDQYVVEGALLAELIAQAGGNAGALPLVSHALLETWRRRRGNTLTLTGYRAAGGIDGALARTAEAIYAGFRPVEQRWAKALFLRLIALGEGTEDTKRPVSRSELGPDTERVLTALADARLVTLADNRVEIAHETLIGAWPRLRQWLTEDRDGLRTQRRLTEDARAWDTLERDSGALYRGTRLALAREWAHREDHLEHLNPVERVFLDTSVRQQDRERAAAVRRTRLLRALSIVLAVLLTAVTAVSVVAVRQRQDAVRASQIAISRQLATQALTMIDSDPDVAKLLAVEAHRTAPTTEAHGALLSMSARSDHEVEINAHTGAVSEIAFAPDGHTLVSAGRDQTAALWDTDGPRLTARLTGHHTWLKSMALNHNGTMLATGGDDQQVMLWNLTDRTRTALPPAHRGVIREIAFSPDDRLLATASDDHTVIVWNVAKRAPVATLTGHTAAVAGVAFSPDGATIATAGEDRSVILWDLPSRTRVTTLTGHTGGVLVAEFSPDGRLLATAGQDRIVQLWDAATRGRVAALRGHGGESVIAARFSPDGRTLATAGNDRTVLLWDVPHGMARARLSHQASVYTVSFAPNGTRLATAGEDGKITLWDINKTPMTNLDGNSVNDITFNPDGRTLATASANETTLWDTTTRSPRRTVTGNAPMVRAVAFSPDGDTAAMAKSVERESRTGNTLTLWNPTQPGSPAELTGHTHSLLDVAFSPDGQTVATASYDKTVILWDITRRTRLATFDVGAIVNGLAFSPDGRTLATANLDDNTVTLWDLTTRTRKATLHGHTGWVRTVVFSPDGRTLVSASADQTIIVWNATTGRRAARITGYTDTESTGAAISPDGHTLAFTAADNTIELWDLQHRTHLARLTGHTNAVTTLAFNPHGHTLASASSDGTTILWDTDTEQTAGRICATLTRNLTPSQWAQFIPDLPYHHTCT
jgi:WD40 repeat protein